MVLTATIATATPISSLYVVRSEYLCFKQQKITCFRPEGVKVKPLPRHIHHPFESKRNVARALRGKHSSLLICAAALNAWCSAAQTQTMTRRSSTITVAPSRGKIKTPSLDYGGRGFPPRGNGVGGGGGGGGGGGRGRGRGGGGDSWAGGFFFFFGFLAFLSSLASGEMRKRISTRKNRY